MAVLKLVPVRLLLQLLSHSHHHFVQEYRVVRLLRLIQSETCYISNSQLFRSVTYYVFAFLVDSFYLLLCYWGIARALKELYFLFPLKFLQPPVVLYEGLFIKR
jgi:hypothetical protein